MTRSLVVLAVGLLLAGCASAPAVVVAPRSGAAPGPGWATLLAGEADLAATRRTLAGDASPLGRLGLALAAEEAGDRDAALLAMIEAAERAVPLVCGARRDCDPWAKPVLRIATTALSQAIDDLASQPALATRVLALELATLSSTDGGDLHLVKASLTARLGERDRADQHLAAAGCGGPFYIAGPFGELPNLDLDTPFDRAVMRRHAALGCRVLLDGPRGRAGVLYAGRRFSIATAGRLLLELEDAGPFRVILDGTIVAGLDEDDRPPASTRRLAIELSAGEHDLWIKVAAPDGRVEIGATLRSDQKLTILDQAPSAAPERAANPARVVARLVEEPLVARAAALGHDHAGVGSQLELLLGALLALADRDSDCAEELAAALVAARPRSATAHLLLGMAYLADNSRPARFASDLARRSFEQALRLRPAQRRPIESLAELDLSEDKARAAQNRLAPFADKPDWRLDVLRYRALRARSLGEQAEPSLDRALAARPLACPALTAAVALYRERREQQRLTDAAERWSRCADGREIKAELAAERFDYATAIAEYRRLLARSPQRQSSRRELARALRASGSLADAVRELEQLVASSPRTVAYRTELADALVEHGQRDAAIAILTAGQKEQPESEELSFALRKLDGKPRAVRWLEPYRVDGLQLIDAYRKAAHPVGRAPAALVLDRTVLYVFASGARLTLTHNIIQLLSKEGIGKFAEVETPEGAELLRLRVIKRDGSVREAEMVSGKQTPSLPDLDVGDFVEFEHVETTGAPAAFPGGFLSERFYFQSFDAPLDRSEYVVVVPRTMKLQVDERAGAPVAERKEQEGLVQLTWVVRQAPQALPEPNAVPHAEYLPSVRVAAGLSIEGWRRFLVNSQVTLLRANRPMRALVHHLTATLPSPEARLAALDAWVRRNIQGGGSIDERASFILERKQGSRSLLLLALLRLAHVDAEMVLARPIESADLDGPLPDLESFNEPLLLVGKASKRAVDPRYRHGPAGVLLARLRGVPALRIAASGDARTTLPATNHDGRKMAIDFALLPELAARVKVTETLSGVPALEWREAIETLPADRIRPEFEQQTLGQQFPGASLVSLGWQNEKVDDQPLTVTYEFTLPNVGRAIERMLLLAAPYPAGLLKRYGQRKERRTAMRLGFVAPTEIETVYHGAVIPEAIDPVTAEGPFGSFRLSSERTAKQLKLTTKLAMPISLVRPGDYAAFIKFAATVDQAEATAARIVR